MFFDDLILHETQPDAVFIELESKLMTPDLVYVFLSSKLFPLPEVVVQEIGHVFAERVELGRVLEYGQALVFHFENQNLLLENLDLRPQLRNHRSFFALQNMGIGDESRQVRTFILVLHFYYIGRLIEI